MSVAHVNVGFQVQLDQFTAKMKEAEKVFEQYTQKYAAYGEKIKQVGDVVSQYVNKDLGALVTKAGELTSRLPELHKNLAKIAPLIAASPWMAVAVAIGAAGLALAAFTTRNNEALAVQKMLNDVNLEAEKIIVKERVELNSLLRVAKSDLASKQEKEAAIKRINAISPEYLGNITLENIKTNEGTAAVNNYVSALRVRAKQQAIHSKMVELESKRAEVVMKRAEVYSSGMIGKIEQALVTSSVSSIASFSSLLKVKGDYYKKELDSIDSQIKALEEFAAANDSATETVKDSGKETSKAMVVFAEGTIKYYEQQISQLKAYQSEVARTTEEYNSAADKIVEIQKKIDALIGKRERVSAVTADIPNVGTQAYYDSLIESIRKVRDAQALGSLEWQKYNNQIKAIEIEVKAKTDQNSFADASDSIRKLGEIYENNAKLQAELDARRAEEAKMYASAVGSAFDALGGKIVAMMGEGESALARFGAVMFETVTKIISMALSNAIANAIVGATQSANATGPAALFTTPAFIATAVGGIMAAFAAIPKFADGGVVYGPTLGLMGEYAGASNNPEVIAPLNKLKELIEPAGLGGVEFSLGLGARLSGSDIELMIERVVAKKLRTQ